MIKKLNVPLSFNQEDENKPENVSYEDMKDSVVAWDRNTNRWKLNDGTAFMCRVSAPSMPNEAVMRVGVDELEEILGLDGE